MTTLSILTDADLDAVNGGGHSFNLIGLNLQLNSSTTNQGQINTSFLSLSRNGGAQTAVTQQSNSVG